MQSPNITENKPQVPGVLPQNFPPPAGVNGSHPQGVFHQYNPFPYGYPSYPPVVAIIGYQEVKCEDPYHKGFIRFGYVPVYGYVYPQPIFVYPQRQQSQVETSKQEEEVFTQTSDLAAIEFEALSSNEDEDFELIDDEVGLSALPFSGLEDDEKAITEFFEITKEDHCNLLAKYIAKAATRDPLQYMPQRYHAKLQLALSSNLKYRHWEDAVLHHPPIEMLNALERIQSIFTTYQKSSAHLENISFLFPCSLSVAENIQQRYRHKSKMKELLKSKDKMVLEVTLLPCGAPYHVFIRPFEKGEAYIKKNFKKHKEEIAGVLKDSNFPPLSQSRSISKQSSVAIKNMIETETHLEFISPDYGVNIKAPKKNVK